MAAAGFSPEKSQQASPSVSFGGTRPRTPGRPAWELDPFAMLSIGSVDEAMESANQAFAEGNWEEAETAMDQAVNALAAESAYSEKLGTALCELSRIFSDNRKYEEARDVAVRALTVAEVLGFDSDVALCALSRRLVAAVRMKDKGLDELIERGMNWLGADSSGIPNDIVPSRALLINTLAGCQRHRKREAEATALEEAYVELCTAHPEFRSTQRYFTEGRIQCRKGNRKVGLELLDLAKSIARQQYSRTHPEITAITCEQAENWRLLEEYKMAEKNFDLSVKGMMANPQMFSHQQTQWARNHLKDCRDRIRKATFDPNVIEKKKPSKDPK